MTRRPSPRLRRYFYFVTAAALVSITLAACGGGGGGGTDPSYYPVTSTAPPNTDSDCSQPAPPNTSLLQWSTPNGLQTFYWTTDVTAPTAGIPIDTSGVKPTVMGPYVSAAITSWSLALNNAALTLGNTYLLTPSETTDPSPVTITYSSSEPTSGDSDELGGTVLALTADYQNLGSAAITYYGWLNDAKHSPQYTNDNARYQVALHELGHAQGLVHNIDAESIMYYAAADKNCFAYNGGAGASPPSVADLYSLTNASPYSQALTTNPAGKFVSGGADLLALGYDGAMRASNPTTSLPGSVFGSLALATGVNTVHCRTGDSFAKRVFDGNPSNPTGGASGPCAPLGTPQGPTNGFGAVAPKVSDPYITVSDAPLSQAEYSTLLQNKPTRGAPVEFPTIVSSIALLYNNNNLVTQVPLTTKQVCAIVAGTVTNWHQLDAQYPMLPLKFIYHSDGGGSTLAFSNYLTTTNGCGNAALSASETFTASTPTTSVIGPVIPANFIGETGDIGVMNAVASTNGAIGYVGAANAKTVVGGSVNFATVDGKNPIKNLPETAAHLTYSNTIATDSALVLNGGPATVAKLSGLSKVGCVLLALPAAYSNIQSGYRIIDVGNALFYSAGNGATNATNLQAFITLLNTSADFGPSGITTIDPATKLSGTGVTGYSALGSSFAAPLKTAASNCIGA